MSNSSRSTSSSQSPVTPKLGAKAEVILAAALQEFLKTGYMGTSLDRIAKAAQVSKPTPYSYFNDKASLFEAVVQQQLMILSQDATSLPLAPDPSLAPHQLLTLVLNRLLDRMLSNTDQHHKIIRLLLGESGRVPNMAQHQVSSIH
ncbi:MAG: TetR/AcrR family transcriptional regulator, partial [Prochlorothrix sp.]